MQKQLSVLKKVSFFLFLAFMTMSAFSQSQLLVGSWRLTAADKILPGGRQVADFGEAPRGIAIFTANGHYVVEIFQTDRIKLPSTDGMKNNSKEYKDTILNMSCHFGTYTVDTTKGTIAFHIDRASFSAWDETTSIRSFTLEGDKLTWRVQPRPDGSIPVSSFTRIP